jgi:hypothetical protein
MYIRKCIFGHQLHDGLTPVLLRPLCGKDFHAGDNVAVAEVTIVIQFLRS